MINEDKMTGMAHSAGMTTSKRCQYTVHFKT